MQKGLTILTILVFLATLIPALTVVAGEDGASLLEERCSVCHPSERPKSRQKTPEQWKATVSRMMGKGAKLTDTEKQVLIKYLSENFKP